MSRAAIRLTGLLLAFALLLGRAWPVFAAAMAEKEEVVYVKLSHDARVDTIYVVNYFDFSSPGQLEDYGDYSAVRNLTTTDELTLSGGAVTARLPAGKFYYEGELATREIPWDLRVGYRLDNKPITGDEAAGASGHLQIDIEVRQKQSAHPSFRDNYAVQIAVTLKTGLCKNIKAPGATAANVGDKKQYNYIVLSGKEGSFTLSADVTDFEMDGVSFNMVPMSLSVDLPDTDEITEELTDQLTQLQDGAVELDDGAGKILDGATEITDGANKLDDGVVQLHDGVAKLSDNMGELTDGVSELQDGVDELLYGARALSRGLDTLKRGMRDLRDLGLAGLGAGFQGIKTLSGLALAGFGELVEGLSGLAGLLEGLDPTLLDFDAIKNTMLAQMSGGFDAIKGIYADVPGLDMALDQFMADFEVGLDQTFQGMEDLFAGLPAPGELAEQMGKLGEYGQLLAYLDDAVAKASAGFDEFAQGFEDAVDGIEELHDGAVDLREGVAELLDATFEFGDGITKLEDGVGDLRGGTTELRDGLSEFTDGLGEFRDGAAELADGTRELRDKTTDMDTEVRDKVDEMLEEYRDDGSDPEAVSFVSPKNTNVAAVQFVMQTEAIEIPEEESEAAGPPPADPTLWDRFLNLFR